LNIILRPILIVAVCQLQQVDYTEFTNECFITNLEWVLTYTEMNKMCTFKSWNTWIKYVEMLSADKNVMI